MLNRAKPAFLGLLLGLSSNALAQPGTLPAVPLNPPADAPWFNTSLPVEQRAQAVVSQMTLEEKGKQLVNRASAIPRLGVPAYNWWSEALHGAVIPGATTVFPEPVGLAATFDTDLVPAPLPAPRVPLILAYGTAATSALMSNRPMSALALTPSRNMWAAMSLTVLPPANEV